MKIWATILFRICRATIGCGHTPWHHAWSASPCNMQRWEFVLFWQTIYVHTKAELHNATLCWDVHISVQRLAQLHALLWHAGQTKLRHLEIHSVFSDYYIRCNVCLNKSLKRLVAQVSHLQLNSLRGALDPAVSTPLLGLASMLVSVSFKNRMWPCGMKVDQDL